jgi:integrase/recombinase XerD
MKRRAAKALEPNDVHRLLKHVRRHQREPERASVIVLSSFKSGLRACEIAGLGWEMVLASDNKIADQLTIDRAIAKMGSGRVIPLHKELKHALQRLHRLQGTPSSGPVVRSQRGGSMTAAGIVNWFSKQYQALGLVGCSSHSGRRTFITASARILAKTGGSLRDIQELAGHRAITTTERYIQGDRAAQRRLISLL